MFLEVSLLCFAGNTAVRYYIPDHGGHLNCLEDNNSPVVRSGIKGDSSSIARETAGKYKSTIQCVGTGRNTSCLLRNLFFEKNQWFLFFLESDAAVNIPHTFIIKLDNCQVSQHDTTQPSIRIFDSESDIADYITSRRSQIKFIPGTTVLTGDPFFPNIGHLLFDGLYPTYLNLIRFERDKTDLFNIAYSGDLDKGRDIYMRFSGGRAFDLNHLSELPTLFLFEEFIMGGGDSGQRSVNSMYALAGGYELDGTRKFRDRMYSRFNYLPPRLRVTSMESRDDSKNLQGIVINNKRFSNADISLFQDLVSKVDSSDLRLKLEYIDFEGYSRSDTVWINPIHSPFAVESPFEVHLALLAHTDVYISGPGTAILYVPFLPDGSVIVALPGAAKNRDNGARGFMEQYLAAGCPYLRAIYYPYNKVKFELDSNTVYNMVAQAASLIRSDFRMPVDQTGNLAPDGQLFKEMCARDRQFCSAVTNRTNGLTACNSQSFWAEDLVHGVGDWVPWGKCARAYNISILDELKEKYGV
jgi:hypothetical protein